MNNIDLLASLTSLGQGAVNPAPAGVGETGSDFESFFRDFQSALKKYESGDFTVKPAAAAYADEPVSAEGCEDAAVSIAALVLIMTGCTQPDDGENGQIEISLLDKLTSFVQSAKETDGNIFSGYGNNILERAAAVLKTIGVDVSAAGKENPVSMPVSPVPASFVPLVGEKAEDEKPKTILELLAEYIAEKQKEKAEEDAEKNALKKMTESKDGEKIPEMENNGFSVRAPAGLESFDSRKLSEDGENASDDGLTELSALLYEFIENVIGDETPEIGGKSVFAETVSAKLADTVPTVKPLNITDAAPKTENTYLEMPEAGVDVPEGELAAEPCDTAKADIETEDVPADKTVGAGDGLPDETSPSVRLSKPEKNVSEAAEKSSRTAEAEYSDAVKKTYTKIEGAEVKESVRAEASEKISPAGKNSGNAETERENLFDTQDKESGGQTAKISASEKENHFGVFMKEAADISGAETEIRRSPVFGRAYDLKDAKDITRLVKTLESAAGKGESKLTVTLTPENLGRLEIRLVENGGKITAKFFTDNESSHKMMLSQSEAIRSQLSDKGIVIDNMEFAFTDTASRQGAGEERRAGKNSGNKKILKNSEEDGDFGKEIASTKKTGIYA